MVPRDPEDLSIEECAELLLNLSAAAADIQIDDESREAIYYCLDRVADHFGIPVVRETITVDDEHQGITIHVKETHTDTPTKGQGPVFRVIDGGADQAAPEDNDDENG